MLNTRGKRIRFTVIERKAKKHKKNLREDVLREFPNEILHNLQGIPGWEKTNKIRRTLWMTNSVSL